jgi:PAS domain S-box-containing protein
MNIQSMDESTQKNLNLISTYQIKKQIYQSANSLVYRAVRAADNQAVILKILKENHPTPEELTRYRQEYEITSSLANLDGVVNAHSIERYQNSLAMCLEDFGGDSLAQLMSAGRSFTLEELLTFATHITQILGQIHRQHIIHKDINPSNIVVNLDTGDLKIIDFGISTNFSSQHLMMKHPDVLEGTLAYMSPEQTGRMNRALDYRTDFYSLGATLYELFTGTVPFASKDAMELVHCHIAKRPVPPHEINSDLPLAISDIIIKLLEKTAETRYQSSWGIKTDLSFCKAALHEKGIVSPFSLAQKDISDRFHIPQRLYGRGSEIETLLTAFYRVTTGPAEIMMVAGHPGIGKSVLIKEIHKALAAKQGYFIEGKFDQLQQNIPYSGIVAAIREMVRQLLSEPEPQLSRWKEKILAALGSNGQVVIDVVPELELIIGPQPAVPQLAPGESQNRFNFVFQNFVQAFCQPEHPLVIFLDDLQWGDSDTFKLLELLATNSENTALLIIGAYRDNEVDPAHPLIMMLDRLREEPVTLRQITLKPLAFEPTNQLIAECLCQNSEAVSPLTKLVMRKTDGNPFFVNQFLRSLYEEGLLHFVPPTHDQEGLWRWDMEQIEAIPIAGNVVDLMTKKLRKLPESTQQALSLAACIGNRFDLDTLSRIHEKPEKETFQELMPALSQGLILPLAGQKITGDDILRSPLTIGHMQFLHDRIQQAAYGLIDYEKKKKLHARIGRLLLNNCSPDQVDDLLFSIVEHLNYGHAFLDSQKEKDELAWLNLRAGQKARKAAAYEVAFGYSRIGLKCLTEISWETNYELTLSLHETAIETAHMANEFKSVEWLSSAVFQHAKGLLDTTGTYDAIIYTHTTMSNYQQAIEIGLDFLKQLNEELPAYPNPLEIQTGLANFVTILKQYSFEEMLNLPEMTDPDRLAELQIVNGLIPAAFFSHPALLPLLCERVIRRSVDYGTHPMTPLGYGIYGVIASGPAVGDFENAYYVCRLALKLLEKQHHHPQKGSVFNSIYGFVNHWVEPIRNSFAPLKEAYLAALEAGDLQFAGYISSNYLRNLYSSGNRLSKVREEFDVYTRSMKKMKQIPALDSTLSLYQAILNLSDRTDASILLDGEVFQEKEVERLISESSIAPLFIYYFSKLHLCLMFGDYEKGIEYGDQGHKYVMQQGGLNPIPHFYFYDTLVRIIQSGNGKNQDERIEGGSSRIKKWAENAPMNYRHMQYLVKAEKAHHSGQAEKAMTLYEKAVSSANQNGFLQDEALAYELAGRFYLEKGIVSIAGFYLKEAVFCYRHWGALAKAKDLEQRYSQFLIPSHPIRTDHRISEFRTTLKTSQNFLDLNTVVKVSNALSGEIVLNQLLKKIIHIVIENTGAEKGFLLMPKHDSWCIEAYGDLDRSGTTLLHSLPFEESGKVPESVIRYVSRIRNHVILENAAHEGDFTRDVYIIKNRPQSVLCAPLLNQGRLTGILYLENNLTSGAFTPERVGILKLISSQIAISLENSILYDNLEQRNHQLAETLQFEEMVSALSARFVNLPPERVDAEIKSVLESIGKILNMDRVSIYRISEEDQKLYLVHSHRGAEIAALPPEIQFEQIPWITRKLFNGETLTLSDPEDLPEEAGLDRNFLRVQGSVSLAVIPLSTGEKTLGVLSLAMSRSHKIWPHGFIRQCRLVADVFANALVRKRHEESLMQAETKYRTVADFTYDWEYWANLDDSLEYVSPSCERISGYKIQDFIANPPLIKEIIVPEDRDMWDRHYHDSRQEMKPREIQFRIQTRDGEIRWIEHNCQPVIDRQGSLQGFRASNRDITTRKRAEELLEQNHKDLSLLAGRIISVQEEELRRLSRELHDDLTQRLAAFAMEAALIEKQLDPSQSRTVDDLKGLRNNLSEVADEVHDLSRRLHPSILDDLGLVQAVQTESAAFINKTGIYLSFTTQGLPESLAQQLSLCLYRVIQEGLQNIAKHSGAKAASISLKGLSNGLRLVIVDNGVGFDPEEVRNKAGIGLSSMRERVRLLDGEISFASKPGQGTQIEVFVPTKEAP